MKSSLTAMVAGMALAGCTSGAGDPIEPLPGSATFDESCPEGPNGVASGDIVKGYEFEGYIDPSRGIGEPNRHTIQMCEFYNPTGDGTFGAGSPFGEGTPKPIALMLNLSAVWCQPCRHEASEVLPVEYAKYSPDGLEIVMVLADTAVPGEAAGWGELDTWVSGYDVQYVATIDTDREFANEFTGASSYPSNILVDTRTMTVVESIKGVPQAGSGFFQKLEQLLEE